MIETLQSAIDLLLPVGPVEDRAAAETAFEAAGGTVRPTVFEYTSDALAPSKKLVETITYLNPISSPGCAAVAARAYAWEDR